MDKLKMNCQCCRKLGNVIAHRKSLSFCSTFSFLSIHPLWLVLIFNFSVWFHFVFFLIYLVRCWCFSPFWYSSGLINEVLLGIAFINVTECRFCVTYFYSDWHASICGQIESMPFKGNNIRIHLNGGDINRT